MTSPMTQRCSLRLTPLASSNVRRPAFGGRAGGQVSDVEAADHVVVRQDRRRTLFGAFCAFVFVPLGIRLIGTGEPVDVVIGITSLATFGTGFLVLVGVAIRPPVLIELDKAGVTFGGALRRQRRTIGWDEIAAARIFRFEAAPLGTGMRMLGLVPADPTSPVWSGRLRRHSVRTVGVPVTISGNTIGIELEQLVDEMRRFKPDLPVAYGEPKAAGLGRVTRPSQWRRAR